MEYVILVAILVVILFAIVILKRSKKVNNAIVVKLMNFVKGLEYEIVYRLYNILPNDIKSRVGSNTVAEIVAFTIAVVLDILTKR